MKFPLTKMPLPPQVEGDLYIGNYIVSRDSHDVQQKAGVYEYRQAGPWESSSRPDMRYDVAAVWYLLQAEGAYLGAERMPRNFIVVVKTNP